VEIEEFVGTWRKLDAADQCCLDAADESTQLGFGAVAGDEMWDQQTRVRIKIGPLSVERYRDFLPTGSAFQPLWGLTHFYSGSDLEFEVQLILKHPEVPPCTLGSEEAGPQLGWLSWIKSTPVFDRNPDDTIFLLTERTHGD
jgi:type VI secretion system protein ImpH